jgi:hypothetical protein
MSYSSDVGFTPAVKGVQEAKASPPFNPSSAKSKP